MVKFLAAFSFILALGSCHPKPPIPPPADPFKTVAIVLTQPLATSGATVYVDDVGGGTACNTHPGAGVTGYCELRIRTTTQSTFVTVQATGYEAYRKDGVFLGTNNVQVWITGPESYTCTPVGYSCTELDPLTPLTVNLPKLVANGQFFSRGGQKFYLKDNSMFNAYELYLKGDPNLDTFIRDRASQGFNSARVFLVYNNPTANGGLGRLVPADYGAEFYTRLPDFIQHFSRAGLYVSLVAFADATTVFGNDVVLERQHAAILKSILANNPNVIVSWVNEADQQINKLPILAELDRIPGVLTSRGSNGSQTWPPQPYLDWIELHTNDAPEEQRKVGHNCMEISPTLPCVTSETSRAPLKFNWANGGAKFGFDSAAGSALLNAGSTFHYDSGKSLSLMSQLEMNYAAAWLAGANSVPLSCQTGVYRHRDDLETPGILRAYQRGIDSACIVKIRN